MDNIDSKVESYMATIRAELTQKYGAVPAAWAMQLEQMRDYYKIYLTAAEEQKRANELITTTNGGKTTTVSQKIQVMAMASDKLDRLYKAFGLNPAAESRIKKNVQPDDEHDDFMNSL